MENRRIENEDVVPQEVKSTAKETVTNELLTTVEESLGDNLRMLFHDEQRGL